MERKVDGMRDVLDAKIDAVRESLNAKFDTKIDRAAVAHDRAHHRHMGYHHASCALSPLTPRFAKQHGMANDVARRLFVRQGFE